MRYIVIGAAGFLGTNLSIKLAEDENNIVRIVETDYTKSPYAVDLEGNEYSLNDYIIY